MKAEGAKAETDTLKRAATATVNFMLGLLNSNPEKYNGIVARRGLPKPKTWGLNLQSDAERKSNLDNRVWKYVDTVQFHL